MRANCASTAPKSGSRRSLLGILAALAEQNGQMVTREELKKRLWPDDTFVDFETGLNTAVSKLRDALSDDVDKPRYIETIPRRELPISRSHSARPMGKRPHM